MIHRLISYVNTFAARKMTSIDTLFYLNAQANDATKIVELIHQRLSYMDQVATYKMKNHLSIEDIPQEKKVMASSEISAKTYGIDPTSIEPFVVCLITISKSIQYRFIRTKTEIIKNENHVKIKNLQELRENIALSNKKIFFQIANFLSKKKWSDMTSSFFIEKLNNNDLTNKETKDLYESMIKIQLI